MNKWIKRLANALLSISISVLKFVVNMMIIGISFVTKKNIPTIKTTKQKSTEMEESIEGSHHVVNQYNSQVEWSEDPKIKERDLLD